MKIKRCFYALLIALFGFTLVACGGEESKTPAEQPSQSEEDNWTVPSTPLQIFVGSESASYYQKALNKFAADYKEKTGKNVTIEVTGGDTGTYTDIYLRDPAIGADIFVAAHDNLGKLLDGDGAIAPVTKKALVNNIESTIENKFLKVIYQSVGGARPQYYAVPIIRQSLVLYYNKEVFAGKEDKLNNWDDIIEVAKANDALATTYLGTDGYSYSMWLLAKPSNEAAINKYGKDGTLQLFQDGNIDNNYAWGDDQVKIHQYAMKFTKNVNGRNGSVAGPGWDKEIKSSDNPAITVVGGAWNKNAVEKAWGKDGYGVTILPTFKSGNYEFRSGSFYDVKCLIKKKGSAYPQSFLDDVIQYLSSDKIQEESYQTCGNLPASTNVKLDKDDALANAQVEQGKLAGTPQPFGYNPTFNPAYYSKGTAVLFVELHESNSTAAQVKKALQKISYIWAHNNTPTSDSDVTDWVNSL